MTIATALFSVGLVLPPLVVAVMVLVALFKAPTRTGIVYETPLGEPVPAHH